MNKLLLLNIGAFLKDTFPIKGSYQENYKKLFLNDNLHNSLSDIPCTKKRKTTIYLLPINSLARHVFIIIVDRKKWSNLNKKQLQSMYNIKYSCFYQHYILLTQIHYTHEYMPFIQFWFFLLLFIPGNTVKEKENKSKEQNKDNVHQMYQRSPSVGGKLYVFLLGFFFILSYYIIHIM